MCVFSQQYFKEVFCIATPFRKASWHKKSDIYNLMCDKVIGLIGERERANLVVQLARFFCLYIYIYIYISGVDVCRNVLRNSK